MELVLADADALPALLQVSVDSPVIVWTDGPGEDAMCPSCDQVVLLGNVPVNSAYDFMIRCAGCGALSRTSEFPPGRGLSGVRTVVPPGTHPSAKVEVFYGQLVVGQPALERRQRETRFGAYPAGTRQLLDPERLREVIDEARDVFGEILPDLERRYARGGAGGHRLPQLIALLEANLAAIEEGVLEINVLAAMQLHSAVVVFRRWSLDPLFPQPLLESKTATTFDHNVLLLTIASVLEDAGLGPELVPPPDGARRSPDLLLRLLTDTVIEVDIKAPVALQRRPDEAVPAKEAKRVVADAISATRGQFTTTSVLVLAGAFWAGDLDEHAEAAAKALGKRLPEEASDEARAHRQNLCGVILASTTVQFGRTRGTGAFEEKWDEVDWSANQSFRWVPNPAYEGAIKLTFADDLSTYDVSVPPEWRLRQGR